MVSSFLLLILLGLVAGGMWSQSRAFKDTIERNQLKTNCLNAVDTITADLRGCEIPVVYYSGASGQGGHVSVATAGEVKLQVNNARNQVITYQLYRGDLQKVVTDLGNSANNGAYTLATDVNSFSFEPLQSGDPLSSRLWDLKMQIKKGNVIYPETGQPLSVKIAVRVGEYAADIPPRISTKPVTTTVPSTSVPSTTTVRSTTTTARVTTTVRSTTTSRRTSTTSRRTTTTSVKSINEIMHYLATHYDRRHLWHGGTYDCWGLSSLMWTYFQRNHRNARIIQFATSYSSNHRQVQVVSGGRWTNIDPANWGFDWLFRSRSVPGRFRVIKD